MSDVDRIEINEAFAAVPLAVAQELQISEDIVMSKVERLRTAIPSEPAAPF